MGTTDQPPLSDADLAAMRERAEHADPDTPSGELADLWPTVLWRRRYAADVRALLAEVERLRACLLPLAMHEPTRQDEDEDCPVCDFCDSAVPTTLTDAHEPECPWRLARECLGLPNDWTKDDGLDGGWATRTPPV